MTREKAIEYLKKADVTVYQEPKTKTAEALEMAIKSLDERKTNTCTNDGEDYAECDQFVCSECGIELQDWHRVERDMDDGEVSYHEYAFRYCPHCGRRIVEGNE